MDFDPKGVQGLRSAMAGLVGVCEKAGLVLVSCSFRASTALDGCDIVCCVYRCVVCGDLALSLENAYPVGWTFTPEGEDRHGIFDYCGSCRQSPLEVGCDKT